MLIYALTFSTVYLLSYSKKHGKIISLIILVLFMGLRYDVGTDYLSYLEIFETAKYSDFISSGMELAYYYLNKGIGMTLGQFWGVTIVQAAIVLGLFYYSFSKYSFYPFALLLFLLNTDCGFVMSVNIMRQAIAVAIAFTSIRYIEEKKILVYTAIILAASLFHTSALFIWPLYFIDRMRINKNIAFTIYLIVSVLAAVNVWSELNLYAISQTSYAGYLESEYMVKVETTTGLVVWFWRILDLIILLNYDRLSKRYPEYRLYLNMFFLFVIFREVLMSNYLLYRMKLYFQWAEFIVYPLFFSLFRMNLRVVFKCILVAMMILVFIKQWSIPSAHLHYHSILSSL